jgi:hypothetical protein
MSRSSSVLVVLTLLVVACTASPAASTAPSLSGGSEAPDHSPTNGPSTTPTAGVELRTTTVEDPYAAALMRIIELGGRPCVREVHVEPAIESYNLDQNAAQLDSAEGMLPEGKAFVGSLDSAARAFVGFELLTPPKEGRSMVIVRADGLTGIADGAPVGFVLLPVPLKDGRTAWLRTGDYAASIPCAAEPS